MSFTEALEEKTNGCNSSLRKGNRDILCHPSETRLHNDLHLHVGPKAIFWTLEPRSELRPGRTISDSTARALSFDGLALLSTTMWFLRGRYD